MSHIKRIVTTCNVDGNPLNGLLGGGPYLIRRGEEWHVLVMSDGAPPDGFSPVAKMQDAAIVWLRHENTVYLEKQSKWMEEKFPDWRVIVVPFHHGTSVYRRYFDLLMQLKDGVSGEEGVYQQLLAQLDQRLLGSDVEDKGVMFMMYIWLAKWHSEALSNDLFNETKKIALQEAFRCVGDARRELYQALARLGDGGAQVQATVHNHIKQLNDPRGITDDDIRAIGAAVVSVCRTI